MSANISEATEKAMQKEMEKEELTKGLFNEIERIEDVFRWMKEKLLRYQSIGTEEEFRALKENKAEIRAQAITEFADAVVAELENIKTGGDCRHKCKYYDWSVGSCEGHCEDYVREKAIETVRNGGRQ